MLSRRRTIARVDTPTARPAASTPPEMIIIIYLLFQKLLGVGPAAATAYNYLFIYYLFITEVGAAYRGEEEERRERSGLKEAGRRIACQSSAASRPAGLPGSRNDVRWARSPRRVERAGCPARTMAGRDVERETAGCPAGDRVP